MEINRLLEIANDREVCDFCVDCDDAKVCVKCEKVRGITVYELREYHSAVRDALREAAEYDKAKQDGRVVVLPCKVGDTVYTNQSWSGDYERNKDKPYCHKVVFVGLNGEKDFFHTVNVKTERMFNFNFADIGKDVFLTREEAEAALEVRNEKI